MTNYKNTTTGIVWTEEEVREAYEQFKCEMENPKDSFEEYEVKQMKKYSLNDTMGRNVPLYKEILIDADSLDEALSAVNAVNYINSCETFKGLPDGIVYSMRALNEDGSIDYSGGWYVVLDRNNPLVQPFNN